MNRVDDPYPKGFTAALYRDYAAGPNNYLISYAGTNDFNDWINNASQAIVEGAPQYTSAMVIAFNLKKHSKEYRINQLTVTGHSLGGGLASAASVWAGVKAYTFNASGLNRKTIELKVDHFRGETREWNIAALHRFDAATRGYFGMGDDVYVNEGITAYYNKLDILNSLQDSDNYKGDLIYNAIGRRIMISGKYSNDESVILVQEFLKDELPKHIKKQGNDTLPDFTLLLERAQNEGFENAILFMINPLKLSFKLRGQVLNALEMKAGLEKMVETHSLFVPSLLGSLYGYGGSSK